METNLNKFGPKLKKRESSVLEIEKKYFRFFQRGQFFFNFGSNKLGTGPRLEANLSK